MIVDMLGRGHDVCGLMVVDYVMILDMTDSFEHAIRQRFLWRFVAGPEFVD